MSLITSDLNQASAAGNQQAAGQQSAAGQGSQSGFDFRSALPEDLRAEKSFEPYSKVQSEKELLGQLARGYHSAQGLIGKKGLIVPGEGAKPEEIHAFNKALGVPDKADDYKFTTPDGYQFDPERIAGWRKTLHEAGVPQDKANRLVGAYIAEEQAQVKAEQTKIATWENETKAMFGANLDKELNHARYAMRELDKDGKLGELLEQTGLGSNPHVVSMLSKMGAALGERGPRGQGAVSSAATLSSDQAQVEIAQFERTSREALFDANHPDHAYAVKRRLELYTAAYPKSS
jgi:hypothetical protein